MRKLSRNMNTTREHVRFLVSGRCAALGHQSDSLVEIGNQPVLTLEEDDVRMEARLICVKEFVSLQSVQFNLLRLL